MKRNISIVIADDHPLLLKGLYDFLQDNNYNVIASAYNGKEALDVIEKHQPDIAILDIEMPIMTGLEVAKQTKDKGLDTKIILLSYHKDAGYKAKAKQLNIRAYLIKEDAMKNIEECIQQVMAGHLFFSETIANLDLTTEQLKLKAIESLTHSEKKILRLIAEKMTSQELAEQLFISKRTVEKHRSNISAKLNLSGKAHELLAWAIENKVLLNK